MSECNSQIDSSLINYIQAPRSYYIYRSSQNIQEIITLPVKQSLPQGENQMLEQRNEQNRQMVGQKDVCNQIISNLIMVDNPLSLQTTPNLSSQYLPSSHRNPTIFRYNSKLYYLSNNSLQNHEDIINKTNLVAITTPQQQQQEPLATKTPSLHITYFNIPNYKKLQKQKFTFINYQSLQRSYQPYLSFTKYRQSSPAEFTRNRLPKLYFPNDLQNLSYSQLPSPNNHIVYLFGGVFKQLLQYSNLLWRIDLQAHTIQLMKQQGEQIQHRQCAQLISFNSNWLILYGGYNFSTCAIYNDFYCYNIVTSTWHIIQTQFQNLLTPRIHPTFIFNHHSNKFYIFGGLLLDHNGNQLLLNDMFQLTLQDMDSTVGKNKKYKGNFTCKTILPQQYDQFPSKRTGHQCVWVSNSLLLLIGGQRQSSSPSNSSLNYQNQTIQTVMFPQKNYHKDVWIFDTRSQKWTEVLSQNTQSFIIENAYFGIQLLEKKDNGILEFLIVGGENSCSCGDYYKMNVSVSKLELDVRAYKEWRRENKKKKKDVCKMCNEDNLHHTKPIKHTTNTFPSLQIDNWILAGMPFPFTAFGLLTHHSIERQSSYFIIYYKQYSQRQNEIVFQDDNYLPYTAEQVNSKIHILGNKDMTDVLGVGDKKYKSLHLREYGLVQFCNHLKIAGLRLGEEVLFIGGNANREAIVFLLRKQQAQSNKSSHQHNKAEQQSVYKSYFYAMNYDTSKLLPGYSQHVRDQVMKSYSQTIKYFFKKSHKGVGTMTKIRKLRKIANSDNNNNPENALRYQLTPLAQKNTIILQNSELKYINNEQLRKLAQNQSIDINLRSYLSICFLNRSTSLLLKVCRLASQKPIATKKEQNNKYKPIVIDDMDEDKNVIKSLIQKIDSQSQQKKKQTTTWKGNSFVSNVAKYIETHQKQSTQQYGNDNLGKEKIMQIINVDDEGNQNQKRETITQKVQQEKQPQNQKDLIKQVQKEQQKRQQVEKQQKQQVQKQLQIQKQQQLQKEQEQQKEQQSLPQKAYPQAQPQLQPQLAKPTRIEILHSYSSLIEQNREIINSFQQIPPQFMLPKIDLLKSKQQLTQIDLDAFNQFDCKTIQVYYWRNKQSQINSYTTSTQEKQKTISNKQQYQYKNEEDQMNNRTKVTVAVNGVEKTYYYKVITSNNQNKSNKNKYINNDDDNQDNNIMLFPNGLLIYYKNRLIKRYSPSFGILASFNKSGVGNLVGVIQLSEKIPVNMFSTTFINEEIQLQQLYSRIQHIAYLYSKNYPPDNNTGKRSRQHQLINIKQGYKSIQPEHKEQQQVSDNKINMKREVNLSMVNNQQMYEQIEGTKKIKQQ